MNTLIGVENSLFPTYSRILTTNVFSKTLPAIVLVAKKYTVRSHHGEGTFFFCTGESSQATDLEITEWSDFSPFSKIWFQYLLLHTQYSFIHTWENYTPAFIFNWNPQVIHHKAIAAGLNLSRQQSISGCDLEPASSFGLFIGLKARSRNK